MVFWVLTSCFPEEARSSVLSPLSRVFLDRASQAQGADGPAHQQTGRLGHLAHPVPRCSLASLRPRLRLSLRDTQHSLLARPLSHRRPRDRSLALLVLVQSPGKGGWREERELHQRLDPPAARPGQPTGTGSAFAPVTAAASRRYLVPNEV